ADSCPERTGVEIIDREAGRVSQDHAGEDKSQREGGHGRERQGQEGATGKGAQRPQGGADRRRGGQKTSGESAGQPGRGQAARDLGKEESLRGRRFSSLDVARFVYEVPQNGQRPWGKPKQTRPAAGPGVWTLAPGLDRALGEPAAALRGL